MSIKVSFKSSILFVIILVVLFLGLSLFSGFVSAESASISNVSFFVGQHQLEYVSLEHPQTVKIVVKVSATNLDSLTADLRTLNVDPRYATENQNAQFSCALDEGQKNTYTCIKKNFYLTPVSKDVEIPFTINADDKVVQTNYSYSYKIDDENPKITSITTNYCDSVTGKCFVKSGGITKINIKYTDSIGTLYQNKVFYSIGNEPTKRVLNCTQGVCTGNFVSSCSSGDRLNTIIAYDGPFASTDDAGNVFEGEYKTVFYCDQYAPAKTKFKFNVTFPDSNGVYDTPKQGDSVILSTLISEDASRVTSFANLSSLTGQKNLVEGSCQPIGDQEQLCNWSVNEILPGDHNIDFTFIDGVGRKTTITSKTMHVDKVVFTSDGKKVPKIFKDVTATLGSPYGYNRVMIGLAVEQGIDYPIFANFKMEKQIVGNVQALQTTIDPSTCMYVTDTDSVPASQAFDVNLANPLSDYNEENRIDVVFKGGGAATSINDIASEFNIVCNVSVITKVNDVVYQTPTAFTISIPMKFSNSALGDKTPGLVFANKIVDYENRITKRWKWVETLNKVASVASDFCRLDGLLQNVGSGGAMMQVAGAVMSNTGFTSVGDGLKSTGNKMDRFTSSLGFDNRLLGNDPVAQAEQNKKKDDFTSFLTKACEFMQCNIEDRMKQYGSDDGIAKNYFTAGDKFGDAMKKSMQVSGTGTGAGIVNDLSGEIFQNINIPNVKESMVAAVMTRCYPAILYHLNQFRQADCKELSCLKINAKTGGDLATCEEIKSQFICQKVLGEAFELPYVRQLKNVVENTNNFVQLAIPNIIKTVTKNTICKDTLDASAKGPDGQLVKQPSDVQIFMCKLPESIGKVMNYYEKNSASTKNFDYPVTEDACAVAFCDKDDVRECEGVTDSLAKKMTGLSVPPDVNKNNYPNKPKFSKVIELLKQSKKGGEAGDQAIKELEAMDVGINIPLLKTSPEYADKKISDFTTLKDSSDTDEISFDAQGDATISFNEWASYGKYYEEEKEYGNHIYLSKKWEHPITNTFVSFLKNYHRIEANYLSSNEKLKKENSENEIALKKLNSEYKEQLDNLNDEIADLNIKIAQAENGVSSSDEKMKEEKNKLNVLETDCKNYFSFGIFNSDLDGISGLSENSDKFSLLQTNTNQYIAKSSQGVFVLLDSGSVYKMKNRQPFTLFEFMNYVNNHISDFQKVKSIIESYSYDYSKLDKRITTPLDIKYTSKVNVAFLISKKVSLESTSDKTKQKILDFCQGKEGIKSPSLDQNSEYYSTIYTDKYLNQKKIIADLKNELKSSSDNSKKSLDQLNAEKTAKEKELDDLKLKHEKDIKSLQKSIGSNSLSDPETLKKQLVVAVNNAGDPGDKILEVYNNWVTAQSNKYLSGKKLADLMTRKINDLEKKEESGQLSSEDLKSLGDAKTKLTKLRNKLTTPISNSESSNSQSSSTEGSDNSKHYEDIASEQLSKCNGEFEKTFVGTCGTNLIEGKLEGDCKTSFDTYMSCLGKIKALSVKQKESDDKNTATINGYSLVYPFKPNITAMDEEYVNRRNVYRRQQRLDRMEQTTDLVATMAKELGWLDWMSLRSYGGDTGAGKLSGFLDAHLSVDSLKQSICSPLIIKNSPAVANGGSVIQCKNNLCQPVFTQATEKSKINNTHYIYALTYYIGSIRYPDSNDDKNAITYQVYFKNSMKSTPLFKKHQILNPGEYAQYQNATVSVNNYDKVCFVFDEKFPPREPNAKFEFCRDIVDATKNDGTSAWDTGRPTTAAEYVLPSRNKTESNSNNGFNLNLG